MGITKLLATSLYLLFTSMAMAQEASDSVVMHVRGLAIKAPSSSSINQFTDFVKEVLGPNGINTLVLRVDYNFAYRSHPELQEDNPLTQEMVEQIIQVCAAQEIEIIPQINLLGHQSWHSNHSKLLEVYPQFDETPHIELPDEYKWPNEDGLYCKSYCPLHPDVHAVVFDLVDEIMDAFQATAFHAGMDEVFYLADERCPRCAGKDSARLFADEVTLIRDHLQKQNRKLWIWGDRLIDGHTTGIGMWEASTNGTHRAIEMIPKDVVICDWHYDRAEPTAPYFALHGFEVITCPWDKAEVARKQVESYHAFQRSSNLTLQNRYLGMMQTVWTSAEQFISAYYNPTSASEKLRDQVDCFKTVFAIGEK